MYTFDNRDDVEIGILAGAYSVTDRLEYYVDKETRDTYFQPIIVENMNSALALVENFDEMNSWKFLIIDWKLKNAVSPILHVGITKPD